jgi:hypothetical protein
MNPETVVSGNHRMAKTRNIVFYGRDYIAEPDGEYCGSPALGVNRGKGAEVK